MDLRKAKLIFLDLETTGLSPAMGDRIVEIGLAVREPGKKQQTASQLINPERPIPLEARKVHGITDEDVSASPVFADVTDMLCRLLEGAWLVGHNLRFDVGFLAMEFALAGRRVEPAGCLDTCQLAPAAWELPDYRLDTITSHLKIKRSTQHRALDDARACMAIFDRIVAELGGVNIVNTADLTALHRTPPAWPVHPREQIPAPLYDALTSGRPLTIGYVNGDGKASSRRIRPHACVPVGRKLYVKALCCEAGEMRTFRLDRIVELANPDGSVNVGGGSG